MLGKRKRSASTESADLPSSLTTPPTSQSSSAILPLTADNLSALDSENSMPPKVPGSPAPPRTPRRARSVDSSSGTATTSKQAAEIARTLRIIRIRILEPTTTLPEGLETLTEWIVDNPRDHSVSPISKDILRIIKANTKENEETLVRKLGRWLTEASEEENEAAGIISSDDRMWEAGCVPILEGTSDEIIKMLQDFYTTPTPKPDITYGFKFEFSTTEELVLGTPIVRRLLDICHGAFFPFLTVEWKSTWNGGTMAAAQVQCARDGAAAVAAMDRLYRAAGLTPTPADTCHFSMGVDQYCVYFHIHWRWEDNKGNVFWEMTDFDSCTLRKEKNVQALRGNLYNIFKWARETRLPRIRERIAKIDPSSIANSALRLFTPPASDIAPAEATPSLSAVTSQTDEGVSVSPNLETTQIAQSPTTKSPDAKRRRIEN
ncbi:hypothetical protein H2199_009094 [Coniosporium tulheliwenetii]|uniref:Uncharacterized protein n=1 Tax=Coniosporium tulheliwenetii TaxID=3383036 RepID=A0ACC2YG93_9PEZI|nr:hypothetical protein H2199_009094 [Cladosporium sp. JES 115]